MSNTATTAGLRVLGLFAHPDDEVFVAGGTLAKYAAEGAEVMVISSTRGQAGQIRDSRIATRRTLGAVREQELRRSAACLGVQHAVCWDYGDGTLQSLDRELLIRDGVVIADGLAIESLRRFKDDVTEVRTDFECGIGLGKYNDIQVGDEIETTEMVEKPRA